MAIETTATPPPNVAQTIAGLVDSVAQLRSTIASLQALEVASLAAAMQIAQREADSLQSTSSRDRDMPLRSIAAEFGAQLRVSDRTVQRQMAEAAEQVAKLPASFRALSEGRISRTHLRVISDAGLAIDDPEARAEFERIIVPFAEAESASRVRPMAQRVADRLSAATFEDRHRTARATRTVVVTDLNDGMAELIATLPAVLAHGIHDRLTQFANESRDAAAAHASKTPRASASSPASPDVDARDDRTIDERRADVLCELLLASTPETMADAAGAGVLGNIRARIELRVPALTLIGRGNASAELVGHGPVDLDTARELAGTTSGWDRVLTHPVSGDVLTVDRYRPSEHLRRTLRVRDEHCRFPGCRMPTARCDIDHTVDAALGGPTSASNLSHLCRRHHSLKHATGWTLVQRSGGVLAWTSPRGREYIDSPVGGAKGTRERVAFRPTGPPGTAEVESAPF